MQTRQVSLIIFYTNDWKILLQSREFKKDPEVEWWYFWWSIDKWETPEQALIRETKEELTYDLKEYKFLWKHKWYIEKYDMEVECFVYISPIDNIKNFTQEEWKKMILVSIEEAKKLKMLKAIDYKTLDMVEEELNLILKK